MRTPITCRRARIGHEATNTQYQTVKDHQPGMNLSKTRAKPTRHPQHITTCRPRGNAGTVLTCAGAREHM
eukprot:11216498-Lingulodinium_polyedra.AAC.1